jgi:CRISPR-associated protein Cas2
MYILVTYDVDTTSEKGQKRLRQVARVCKNYGQRVQNSVFECEVTEALYTVLKSELYSIMDDKLDSIRFYHLNKNKNHSIETLGRITSYDVNDAIIL